MQSVYRKRLTDENNEILKQLFNNFTRIKS